MGRECKLDYSLRRSMDSVNNRFRNLLGNEYFRRFVEISNLFSSSLGLYASYLSWRGILPSDRYSLFIFGTMALAPLFPVGVNSEQQEEYLLLGDPQESELLVEARNNSFNQEESLLLADPQDLELFVGALNNPFNVEEKSFPLVFNQNSENDQRYRAMGCNLDKIPEGLTCSIIDQIFTTPVRTKDNIKLKPIELLALVHWCKQSMRLNLYKKPLHPFTGKGLDMKSLCIDRDLAQQAKNFVDSKIAKRITKEGNLLICNRRLYSCVEKSKMILITMQHTLFLLKQYPPITAQNLKIGQVCFDLLISRFPKPRKQMAKKVFERRVSLFRGIHGIAASKPNQKNVLAITYKPGTC